MRANWIGLYTFISREIGRMFRVWIQTLIAPWSGALLYILIFGRIVGQRIAPIHGVHYIDFVLPGLVMMNVIASAFLHTSSSVYFMRFVRHIEEILVAPLSYVEMIVGFIAGGVARAIVVGVGVYAMAVFFTTATVAHFWLLLFYLISISIVFSLLGMLVGLWSKSFEQLSLPSIFIITPLTFLGGVFNSIDMLPPQLKWITLANPFFYFVDGFRYAMIGIRESNATVGNTMIIGFILVLGYLIWHLFKIGWRIKE